MPFALHSPPSPLPLLALAAVVGLGRPAPGDETPARWFPTQSLPKGVVRTELREPHADPLAVAMTVQSVAGLAAQAVNEVRDDELVWVSTDNVDVERWGERFLKHNPGVEVRGTFKAWDLVEHFRARGVVKGYILYRSDPSAGPVNDHRAEMDLSVNVATSLAGLLQGVIVEEKLEPEARKRGLARLADARSMSQEECFAAHRGRLHRRMLVTQDPKKANVRDLAIAHRALTVYGPGPVVNDALAWLEPLSPVIGWNGGDEFQTTRASTLQGHFQTATDWCTNLPVLMAGSDRRPPVRARGFDPSVVDWSDRRSALGFVLTDGDNVQWMEIGFASNRSYWANPARGRIPFGWSACPAHLAQLAPDVWGHLVDSQGPNDHFVEWGGGYYYPDLFARDRPDRWDLLARHARRTWDWMARNNTRVIGFNVADHASPDARKAYEVFAAQTDGLVAILVFRYDRYEGGAGEVFWVKDRRGVEVPVMTARYSIWEHTNGRPRSGTPAKVAREIRETVAAQPPGAPPRYDWAIANVWSYFRPSPDGGDDAENLAQDGAERRGGVRGYDPVLWCARRLPAEVRLAPVEELAWRLRMRRNPEQTRTAVGARAR